MGWGERGVGAVRGMLECTREYRARSLVEVLAFANFHLVSSYWQSVISQVGLLPTYSVSYTLMVTVSLVASLVWLLHPDLYSMGLSSASQTTYSMSISYVV